MKILEKTLYIFASIIFLIIFLSILMCNKYSAILAILIVLVYYVFIKKIKVKIQIPKLLKKYFPLIIFLCAFIVRFICLKILKIEPCSDFAVLLGASENLKNGINVMLDNLYFEMWGYQTGYVLYQTTVLKLFGSVQFLHILDCIYASTICVLIYYVGKKVFNTKQIIPSVLYTFYIFGICYTGVLSNQHLYTVLTLLAILLLLSDNIKLKFWKYPLVGIILALSNIIRPEAVITICAIIGYEVLRMNKKEDIKYFIRNILCMLLIYFVICQATSIIIKSTGINPSGLENKNTLWKFVCGLDIEANGEYSVKGEKIITDQEKEKAFIKKNIEMLTPYKLIRLLKNKVEVFWGNEAYDWVFTNWDSSTFNVFEIIDKTFYILIFGFAILSVTFSINNNENKEKNILIIICCLIAFIYLFIEVQARYSYTAKVFIFILASDGINKFNEIIKNSNKELKGGSLNGKNINSSTVL